MADLSILFLQVFLGIMSPTPDQINSVTYDQQKQAATVYYSGSTTTAPTTGTLSPYDPDEVN